jgi:hypothetical protein
MPGRFEQIGSVLTARGEAATVLIERARALQAEAQRVKDEGRIEEARERLAEAGSLTEKAAAEAQEVTD